MVGNMKATEQFFPTKYALYTVKTTLMTMCGLKNVQNAIHKS